MLWDIQIEYEDAIQVHVISLMGEDSVGFSLDDLVLRQAVEARDPIIFELLDFVFGKAIETIVASNHLWERFGHSMNKSLMGGGAEEYANCVIENVDKLRIYDKDAGASLVLAHEVLACIKEARRREAHKQTRAMKREEEERRQRERAKGFVYLLVPIGDELQPCKIGKSRDPNSRGKLLGTQAPYRVKIGHIFPADDMAAAEQALHTRFAAQHTNGEWFRLSAEQIDWIKQINAYCEREFGRNASGVAGIPDHEERHPHMRYVR